MRHSSEHKQHRGYVLRMIGEGWVLSELKVCSGFMGLSRTQVHRYVIDAHVEFIND